MITCDKVLRTSRVVCVCIYSIEPERRVEYRVGDDVVNYRVSRDLDRQNACKSAIASTIGYAWFLIGGLELRIGQFGISDTDTKGSDRG